MRDRIRAYPMIILLLPLVAAILFSERKGWLYPAEYEAYDSVRVYTFVLMSESKPTAKCERYKARCAAGDVYLYLLRDSTRAMPEKGDTIVARTSIQRPKPIGNFDYGTYLLRNGISGTSFAGSWKTPLLEVRKNGEEEKVPLQKRLYNRLAAAGLSGDELATTGAMTLGYKEDLDPGLRHRFQASGAAHVLAVSGLHTGIIYAILLWLLTLGGRIKPMHENRLGRCALSLVIIGVMWFYAWLTGLTPSVVRAVLMVTIFEVGRMAYKDAISLNTIGAAAVLILLVRPLDLFSVSFQLSFAATAAIVLVARGVQRRWELTNIKHSFGGRILDSFLGIIIVSLAAQIGTLPITMYTFGQFSTYFLLTNMIVLPLATFLVPFGLASIALGGSVVGIWVGKATWGLAWMMNHSVGWIESLPWSTIPVSIGLGMVVIYYVLWMAVLIVNR